jgi:Methyltransferase domain
MRISRKKLKRCLNFVFWGNMRRLQPFSNIFGYDRGCQSVARYYIDQFIKCHVKDIRGTVLEIGDKVYTSYGGQGVLISDVLHVEFGNPKATIVADLTIDYDLPNNNYDCIIMTQTLPFIYNYRAALKNTYSMLKPGGVLLVTLSGISQISSYDDDRWGDYWRFTKSSAQKLFEDFFELEKIEVQSHGNVLSAVALLQGLASHELKQYELDYRDPNYQVIITVRAIKK